MKSSFIVCALIVLLAGVAADGALADPSINYNASKSNTGNVTVGQTTCPSGQAWNAVTRKCVATSSVNYNSSKSNTGNMAAPAPASQTANVHKPTDTSSTPPK
jgi:hypothetical protein